jgi:hypothetical protein
MHQINKLLIDLADWTLNANSEKAAFVPSEAAAAAGGPPSGEMPPADPAAAADPMAAAAGGPPPMGGPPPGAGSPPPVPGGQGDPLSALVPVIQQIVTQTMQQMGMGGGGMPGGAPGAPGAAGAGGKAKIDPAFIYQELSRVRKMLSGVFEQQGWPLPPDILDDPAVGALAMGQSPVSAPIGAEGGAPGAAPPGGAPPGGAPPGGAPASPGGFPAIGTSPAIQPIQPPKQASDVLGFPDVFGTPTQEKLTDQEQRLQALARTARQRTTAA